MPKYPQPEGITAPKLHWSLIKVLHKGDPEDYSIAIGKWDNESCLALRWNACEGRPIGNPQSRGLPTWFIVPNPLVDPILGTLDSDVQAFARNFLPVQSVKSQRRA